MLRIIFINILFLLCLFHSSPLFAEFDDDKIVLRIDSTNYTVSDFKAWWERYRDDQDQKIEGIDTYLEWLLLLKEAKTMELDSLAEYRRKVDVFIKSRTLMLLQNDEIDSKIDLSDSRLYDQYLQEYVPRRLVALVECSNSSSADKLIRSIGLKSNISHISEFAAQNQDSCRVHSPQWLRPNTTPEAWKGLLDNMDSNSISTPFKLDNTEVGVLFVEEQVGAEQTDFMQKKGDILYRLRKELSQNLTEQLIIRLRKKYNVRVNKELIDAIDLYSPDETVLNEIVISSDRSNVTVQYFIDQCLKHISMFENKKRNNRNDQDGVKNQILNAMIANSLVSWEAMDRDYQNKPPFKDELLFHKQYRLVKDFEKRLYGDISVDQNEINQYYSDNRSDFITPEKVRIVLLQGTNEAIFNVWTRTLTGGELMEEADKLGVSVSMGSDIALPINHFQSETLYVLKALNEGDISAPYIENDTTKLLKLLSRTESGVAPLEKVQNEIVEILIKQKKDGVRAKFLDNMREKTNIKIE
nr:peptidyl-prolyl cis-trans isomerase [Desulfobulbaceae bacterium]